MCLTKKYVCKIIKLDKLDGFKQQGFVLISRIEDCKVYNFRVHDASSSDTETSIFFSGDHATQQTLSIDPTELRTDQISIKGLAILILGAVEK